MGEMKQREAPIHVCAYDVCCRDCMQAVTDNVYSIFHVVHGCAVVCKNSTHLETWKIGSFCPFFMTQEFKPDKFHGLNFAKTSMSQEENCCCNMCSLYVHTTCILVYADLYVLKHFFFNCSKHCAMPV